MSSQQEVLLVLKVWFCIVATMILLKICGVLELSWVWVLSPWWGLGAGCILWCAGYGLVVRVTRTVPPIYSGVTEHGVIA